MNSSLDSTIIYVEKEIALKFGLNSILADFCDLKNVVEE